MRKLLCLPVLALLALAACGDPVAAPPGGFERSLLEASASVLESADHGPELCLGTMTASLPPSCGGIPIVGWDWNAVEGEEKVGTTTWGEYHVVGTYDGSVFTLSGTPGPPQKPASNDSPSFDTPCPQPLAKPDPSKTSQEDFDAAAAAAQKAPDYAIVWIDAPLLGPPGEPWQDVPNAVLNAAFTGNLEGHEAELRTFWGGRLCVSQKKYTSAKLRGIADELYTVATELGLKPVMVAASEIQEVVELHVVFGDQADQAALDARYGEGLVRLTSELKPVS